MIPDASVIIPTFEEWQILQKCLDCLAQQSITSDRFEVIVANNNLSSEVPLTLRLPANARVIHVPKPGSYAARNAALREARGAALFFTDSDCQPDPHWIENGLTTLADLGPVDRIAGAVDLFPKGKTLTGPGLYELLYLFNQRKFSEKGFAATANLVTSRAAFDLVGPFNEDSFSSGDSAWGLRATELGSRIVFSQEVLIRHPAREVFSDLAKKRRRLIGDRHQSEVSTGVRKRWTVSYLFPRFAEMRTIALDARLSEPEKLLVFWVHYRLSLVIFLELVRLRYLSGVPNRS